MIKLNNDLGVYDAPNLKHRQSVELSRGESQFCPVSWCCQHPYWCVGPVKAAAQLERSGVLRVVTAQAGKQLLRYFV